VCHYHVVMTLTTYMSLLKITDAEMASILGCSVSLIRKYRSGERFPRPKAMLLIAEKTNGRVTYEDFYAGLLKSVAAA
jgi:transcriptional regulator with XRE-family HTH domain